MGHLGVNFCPKINSRQKYDLNLSRLSKSVRFQIQFWIFYGKFLLILVESFYSEKYGLSITTSNVPQIISVMKTKTLVFPEKWYFKNSSLWHSLFWNTLFSKMISNFWRFIWKSLNVKSKKYFSRTDFQVKIYYQLTLVLETLPLRSQKL